MKEDVAVLCEIAEAFHLRFHMDLRSIRQPCGLVDPHKITSHVSEVYNGVG